MTISRTSMLSEPHDDKTVPATTLSYFRHRLKQRIFNAMMTEFKASNMTKADLARRLGKDPAQISKILSGPGNVTLETVSDVLFAISGGELSLKVEYPLGQAGKSLDLNVPGATDLLRSGTD